MRNFLERVKNKIRYLFGRTENIILFESEPVFSDNTYAVYKEMLRRGINKKYKMIWWVPENFTAKSEEYNVEYLGNGKDRELWEEYCSSAKCLICCNKFLPPCKRKQFSIYLTHGVPIKRTKDYYVVPKRIEYCLAPSSKTGEIISEQFRVAQNKIVCLGYPRNDELINAKRNLHSLFDVEFDKIVVWYPTFRQHKYGFESASTISIPIIHDELAAEELNTFCKENKVLVVLKPHFGQNTDKIKLLNLDYVKFIDDSFFEEHSISSYSFVGSCDALITDYSSIYYDFTLCDKPIAVTWEDIEEYKKSPGLIDNYECYMIGAEKVYTLEDLKRFLSDVSSGRDSLKNERSEIRDLMNISADASNSKRVVDFIIEKADLKL